MNVLRFRSLVSWLQRGVFSLNTCSCAGRDGGVSDETDSCSRAHRWPVSTGRHSSLQMWDFIPQHGCFIIVLCRQDNSAGFTEWSATIWHLLPTDVKLSFWIKQCCCFKRSIKGSKPLVEEPREYNYSQLLGITEAMEIVEYYIVFEPLWVGVYHLVDKKVICPWYLYLNILLQICKKKKKVGL